MLVWVINFVACFVSSSGRERDRPRETERIREGGTERIIANVFEDPQ